MHKEQAIDQVKNSLSSIFTKEDVIQLLNSIEHGYSVDYILDNVESALHNITSDEFVCHSSAKFSIENRTIYLDDIDVDVQGVMKSIREQVKP